MRKVVQVLGVLLLSLCKKYIRRNLPQEGNSRRRDRQSRRTTLRFENVRESEMNSVSLIGRITADPEIRYLESGKQVSKFSIAVNRSKDEADFFDVEAWDKQAEVIGQYCKKGSQVGISGSLHQERWRDKTTETNRSKVIVRCARIELLGSKQDSETQAAPQPDRPPSPAPQPVTNYAKATASAAAAPDVDYDDIPF